VSLTSRQLTYSILLKWSRGYTVWFCYQFLSVRTSSQVSNGSIHQNYRQILILQELCRLSSEILETYTKKNGLPLPTLRFQWIIASFGIIPTSLQFYYFKINNDPKNFWIKEKQTYPFDRLVHFLVFMGYSSSIEITFENFYTRAVLFWSLKSLFSVKWFCYYRFNWRQVSMHNIDLQKELRMIKSPLFCMDGKFHLMNQFLRNTYDHLNNTKFAFV
jgi:hypothetical protein